MSSAFTESIVEDATLAWLEALGCAVLHDPEIAVGESATERSDANYCDVILKRRLQQSLVRLRLALPGKTIDDPYRKMTLAALRDTLLPKLLSGEIRVPIAQERVSKTTKTNKNAQIV